MEKYNFVYKIGKEEHHVENYSYFCDAKTIYKIAFSYARYCRRYSTNATFLVYRKNRFIYGFFVNDYFGINHYLVRFYDKCKSTFIV